ncbi:MAG TPA: peptidase M48 [Cyanothece sp. UBA12306]|nr:peptidase M48 [Cyanothece sp. UBA12306]
MNVRWYISLVIMGVFLPNSIVIAQDIASDLEKIPVRLSDSQSYAEFYRQNSLSEDKLLSEAIAPKKKPESKKTSEPASTTTKTQPNVEDSSPEEEASNKGCNAAFPEFAYPNETETETVAQKTNESSSPLDQVITINKQPVPPETDTEVSENKEEIEEIEEKTPSPEEINRYQTLAKADHLYRCGDTLLAERFYREIKTPFEAEKNTNRETTPEPIYEAKYLLPAGGVYWRLYQESLQENHTYKSKKISALKLLTEKHPEFIPGHLHYAEVLEENNQEEAASKILENAASLYPNEPSLVAAKIKEDEEAENWLAASLTARQFFLFNQDHFRAPEFKKLADQNLRRYQEKLRGEMTWNFVGNAVMGGIGVALMGNVFAPLSTLETSYLLLQGESVIGKNYANGVKNQVTLVEDPEVEEYIDEIGQKLASVAGRDEFEYEFYVIMDENINAFALPGGKIFINAGAIAKTNSEAEIAGLIAHELAHTVLSHGFQQMTQGSFAGSVVQYIPYVGGIAGNLIVLNYSRGMEKQADQFGTRLLAASGYAADGMRNLMVIMEAEDKNSPPAWLSSHPDTSDRVEYLEKAVVRYNFNRYAYEGVEKHYKIKQKVTNLLAEFKKEQEGEEEENKEDKPQKKQEN